MGGLLDDNPASADTLGFGKMAAILHTVIQNTHYRPFTIGVFGAWGSGKTTLMKLIEKLLEDDGVKTVWFNAWKYDSKEVIWNALIQQIFYTMQTDPEVQGRADKETFIAQVKRAAGTLATYAAKVATRFVPGGIVKEEDVDALLAALRPASANDDLFAFINRFEDQFDKLVKEYVGSSEYLVIFIDDLDRCLPENAITVMEALKLYLDRASCIFVIGAESSIIEEGITQRYRDNPGLSARDYLEKVIQLPFVVPRIEAENALALLEGDPRPESYKDDPAMRALIVEGTDCNPRRLKRFINSLWVSGEIAGELTIEQWRLLAKVSMIQMRFPKLYEALVEDPELIERMTASLAQSPRELELSISGSPTAIQALFRAADLRAFLQKTKEIPCPPEDIRRWVMLTKGQAPSAIGSIAGS